MTVQKLMRALRDNSSSDVDFCLDANDTLLVCSFELPLKVVKDAEGKLRVEKQKSCVMPLLHDLRRRMRIPVRFVGWAGYCAETEEEKVELVRLLEPQNCVPIHMSRRQVEEFVQFSHCGLRPVFHNVIDIEGLGPTKEPFNNAGWRVYQSVNRLFADVIVAHASETDPIWVHDYHLLLCPQYITRRLRRGNVGLFLHVPFPSSEIFRCLPVREDLLRGMLCADLIGFHFFEYARHFLVSCKRLLGLEHHFRIGGFLELDYGGRNVMLRIGHVQLQYDDLRHQVLSNEWIQQTAADITEQFSGKFIIASVDRCEPLSGAYFKLQAFRHFLVTYPYAREEAMLIQYVYLHRMPNDDYALELKRLCTAINAEFSASEEEPVVLLRIAGFGPHDKYALFQAADCLLDGSLRDGLNLNPFEYIVLRDTPAPLVVSEFTGCCRSLATAIRVNPWKVADVAQALDRAIHSPQEELRDRFLRDQMFLQRNSCLSWADEFLLDLRRARKKESLVYVSWGFGNSYKVVGMDKHFNYLDADLVVSTFRASRRAAFFFDHEGTLAPDRRRITAVPGHEYLSASGSAPSIQVQQCLSALCAAGHCVVILSGRGRDQLDQWFGSISGIGLCAEHGYYYKVPQLTGAEWRSCAADDGATTENFTWKQIAMEMMQQYVKRTQGAFVENKGSALVFQYRDADPDFGSWQAKELATYLEELLFSESSVQVATGKGYVEVKLKDVSKGRAIQRVLEGVAVRENLNGSTATSSIDFILCIGDDRSDEAMFPVVNSFFGDQRNSPTPAGGRRGGGGNGSTLPPIRSIKSYKGDLLSLGTNNNDGLSSRRSSGAISAGKSALPAAYSVTVGKKPSDARYYLNDIDEVSELLEVLVQQS